MKLNAAYCCVMIAALALASTQSHGADADSSDAAEQARRIEYIQKALKGEGTPVPGKRIISAGTGFYVTPRQVLTNRHVVDGCAGVTLRGAAGETVLAANITVDKSQDLALVGADAVPSATIATFRTTVGYTAGDTVGTVGFPDHGLPRIEPYLTKGLVMGPDREDGRPSRFAIRADIRQGNSGGPVLDDHGSVIGIMNAKLNTVSIYRRTGQTVDNVGIAIANGPIFDFLKRQGVKPTIYDSHVVTPEQDLLGKVRFFIVRIACWR